MDILLDYENVAPQLKRFGVKHIASTIISEIKSVLAGFDETRVQFRLYGGWYQDNSLSQLAQKLSRDIENDFPFILSLSPFSQKHLIIQATLALSLKSNPMKNLFFTFREKSLPRGIKCRLPREIGCDNVNCTTQIVYKFFNNETNNSSCCNASPKDLFYRAEQKLVDTMLASDALYDSLLNRHPLIIVTSDDDLWPVIETVASYGLNVYHIHPNPERKTKAEYTTNITKFNYHHFSIGVQNDK